MRTTVVIIGAGQAGLAMSHCLTGAGVDHVLLERGQPANSWRTQRWDSLRLLSPNWMVRLPGHRYGGDDPDGYMKASELATVLADYGDRIAAPVHAGVTVTGLRPTGDGFVVDTDSGPWSTRAVVVASGACTTPHIPAIAGAVPASVRQITPIHYRNPGQLGRGPVLVVGASSSGVQIADELARSGRDVVLTVGDHVRVPRRYRGMDILWWMEQLGLFDDRIGDMDDPDRARRLPSLQVIGSPEGRSLDLNSLGDLGVVIVGRLAGVTGTTAQLSGSLANFCASADLKQRRLLDEIDDFAHRTGLDGEVDGASRPEPTRLPAPRTTMDLARFDTVVWATGFRPNYPWMDPSMLDRTGAIDQVEGIGAAPGLYTLGLPFMRRRKSALIDGAGPDAAELARHLVAHLASADRSARSASAS